LVPAGAEVMILTKTDLYSNTVFVGERFTFEVARDVIIDGRVVIAEGAPVEAVITLAILSRSFGRGGKLGIGFETVTAVDGQKIRIMENEDKSPHFPHITRRRAPGRWVQAGGAAACAVASERRTG